MSKKKSKITSYLLLPLVYILTGVITYGNHIIMISLTLMCCFFMPFIFKKTYNNISAIKQGFIYLGILWFCFFVTSIVSEFDFRRSLLYLIFMPIFLIVGFRALKKHFLLYLMIIGFCGFIIIRYGYITTYLALTDDQFLEVNRSMPKMDFYSKDKEIIKFKKKITVLDFWNTKCRICFKKFPYFEKLSDKYSSDLIDFYSVNVPFENESFEDLKFFSDSLGFNYKTIFAKSMKEVQERLEFNSYPHVVILKNDTIVYSGNFISSESLIRNSLEKQIQKVITSLDTNNDVDLNSKR